MSADENHGLNRIANAVGLSPSTLRELAEQAKANVARLSSCTTHLFEPVPPIQPLRTKYRCALCEGVVDSHAFHWYTKGREHALNLQAAEVKTR